MGTDVGSLMAWFQEAANLRRFALWNVWFWLLNHVVIVIWYIGASASFQRYGFLYLDNISVAALWLSSLAWWQSTRVEEQVIASPDIETKT